MIRFLGVKPMVKKLLDSNGALPKENQAGEKGRGYVEKPEWNIVNKSASFQMIETLNGPGLVNHTLIERTTDIESLTETTSTFTQ